MSRLISTSFIILLLLTTPFFISGCTGRTEIEDIGLVRITGIDWNNSTNRFEATILALKSAKTTTQMGKGQQKGSQVPWVATADGETVADAIKNLRGRAASKLKWTHSTDIIVGEELARKGFDKFFDFFVRNPEIAFSSNIFIARGTAKDILKITPEMSTELGNELDGMAKYSKEWGKDYVPSIKDFLISISFEGNNSIAGVVETMKPIPYEKQQTEESPLGIKSSKDIIDLNGSAVIKDYKLVGWLDREETRGYLWVENKLNRTAVDVGEKNNVISVEINKVQSKVDPEINDNVISINIEIKTSGNIVELDTNKVNINSEGIADIENKVSEQIKTEVLKAISKSKNEFKTDIFQFGRKIYGKYPEEWEKIKKSWSQVYPEVDIKVQVSTKLKSTGMASQPITKVKGD